MTPEEKATIADYFYSSENEEDYRVLYCEEEHFICEDETTGEHYTIRYDEVTEDCKFYKLEEIK